MAEELTDEIAAQLANTVDAARTGVWVREREVVVWVDEKEAASAVEKIRAFARSVGSEVEVRKTQPEDTWRDAWKKYFRTTRITRQLVIVPSWDTFTPGEGDLEMHLDPGQAFGTGDHSSTRLVLQAMQTMKDEGIEPRRVLDVGTGSGILSVAAARLWPNSTGISVDCDEHAVRCAQENLQTNGVAERFLAQTTDVADVPEAFDLVLANIELTVLLPLRDALLDRTASGGRLILSGLLVDHATEALEAYQKFAGVQCEWDQRDEKDPQWRALLFRKP